MNGLTIEELKANLERIRDGIADSAHKAGRDPKECRIMAVTKGQPEGYVSAAISCGQELFGENRVQEAQGKFEGLLHSCELELLGHLQRNKAQAASRIFSCVQSIDKLETAGALDAAMEKIGKKINVLIEVNTSGESTKFGVSGRSECFALLDAILELKYLSFLGLMTVGPLSEEEARIRKAFSSLRDIYEDVRSRYADAKASVLSMGMSSDYRIAVEEGSTLVRIGTALFGKREQ